MSYTYWYIKNFSKFFVWMIKIWNLKFWYCRLSTSLSIETRTDQVQAKMCFITGGSVVNIRNTCRWVGCLGLGKSTCCTCTNWVGVYRTGCSNWSNFAVTGHNLDYFRQFLWFQTISMVWILYKILIWNSICNIVMSF